MNKIKYLFFFLLVFVNLSSSCNNKECGLALADLVTEIAFTATVNVFAGESPEQAVSIPNLIENLPNLVQTCSNSILNTETANPSISGLQIDYDNSGTGIFNDNVLNANYNVPAIPPGNAAEEGYTFNFTEPGDYQLITFADVDDDVDEREEDNNASGISNVSAGRLAPGAKVALVITVLPNPDYTRPEGTPFVKVSRTVEIVEL